MQNRHQAIFLNYAQAVNKDLTIGRATWMMQNQADFEGALNPQVGLLEFSFTNFFVNVTSTTNTLYFSNDTANPTKYAITIPVGSYSVNGLNTIVAAQEQMLAGSIIFSLQGNYATNQLGIVFGNVTGWYVHFGGNSPYTLCGFANGQNVPATKANTANYVEYAPNTASFNSVTTIQVACDLTSASISNGAASNIIYQTTPTVSIGSTQSDRPTNIVYCALTNTRFSEVSIRLIDQNNSPISMYDYFAVTLVVTY
jgi:hypothetical protein